jgi:Mg/Co/Ni transporter MgtE
MLKPKKIRDVMVDIFEFPHIPYWYTIKQAIEMIQTASTGEKNIHPPVILVFEEKYNLVGVLGEREILRGLEPKYLSPAVHAQFVQDDESALALIWDSMFDAKNKEHSNRPVSDVMLPAKHFVDVDDPLTKAAYLLVRHDLSVLPVLENKKKMVGVVRMSEILDELSKAL